MKFVFIKLTFIPILVTILTRSAIADYKTSISLHKQQQYILAFIEFELDATGGHTPSQYFLGIYYSAGYAVDADHKTVKFWYEKAAKQNDIYAQNNLGNYYSTCRGDTELNYGIAIYWCKKAAAQGDVAAVYNLGQMYESGFDYAVNMPRDIEKYTIAANQVHADAQYKSAIFMPAAKAGKT